MQRISRVLEMLETIGFRRWHTHANVAGPAIRSHRTRLFRPCCYEMYYINTNFINPEDISYIGYTDIDDKT